MKGALHPQSLAVAARWRTTVIYGPSGAGKTTLAATAPKPLFIDSNRGLAVLLYRPEFEHVRSVPFENMKTLDVLLKHFRGQKKPDYSTIYQASIFDHFDDIQSHILEQLGIKGAKKDTRRDPDILELRDWGKMGNQLRRYIRAFKQVPVHKILICSEREDSEGMMRPALLGSLKEHLPYFTDDVLYLDQKHRLWFDSTEHAFAKTRAHWLKPGGGIKMSKKGQRYMQLPFDAPDTMTKLYERIAATQKRRIKGDR